MVEIIFEPHGTTFDNEKHLSSGRNNVALSPLGEQQSKEMGERYKGQYFDAVFTSELQRSVTSAVLAFPDRGFKIISDPRLSECDYGELTQHPSSEVDQEKPRRIHKPFPGGESYDQCAMRMKSFLNDLFVKYNGKKIMIIGHRATQYGLEHWINEQPLEKIIPSLWKWQPGWKYELRQVLL
jgi:broad specificity phosphatase PhoE